MAITHHADDATLMSFSAGTLCEALSAVVASHVAMCPRCQQELACMDMIGGLMIEALPAVQVAAPCQARARLPEFNGEVRLAAPPAKQDDATGRRQRCGPKSDVPAPLARLVGNDMAAVPWQRLGPGIWHHRLPLSDGAKGDLRLLRIAPGQKMPEHGHSGTELSLVLAGSYTDEVGRFGRGDLADLDEGVEHQPVSCKKEGCICLIASEDKARFKSVLVRLIQPFIGL